MLIKLNAYEAGIARQLRLAIASADTGITMLGVAALGLYLLVVAPAAAQDTSRSGAIAGRQAPVAVSIKPAAQLFLNPARQAPATVLAKNQSRVSAQLAALITGVSADVGAVVKAGDVLVTLDDADVKLSMAQALAQRNGLVARLNLANRQLKRLRDLKSNNFVTTEAVNQSDAQVVTLRAELQVANAHVASIERQLEKCVVRAPFAAVVTERSAQLGELSAPGTPLLTLVQLGDEEITAAIALSDARYLSAANRFELIAGGEQVSLSLLRISPVVSSHTRTHEARFAFAGRALASGSQGIVQWTDARPHLPPSLVVRRGSGLGVFVVKDGKASFILMSQAQEGRPVASDLDPSATIVVKGQETLQDGQVVKVSTVAAVNGPVTSAAPSGAQ